MGIKECFVKYIIAKVSSSRRTCTYSRRPALIIRASIRRRKVWNSGGRSHLAHGDGRFPRLFRSLTKTQLLILDDWGPDRLTASQRRDLMEIVEDRYGAGSTLITSQLPLSTWHDVIGEPTFADAILDRIVHNAYRLELSGQSLRKTMAKTGDENCQRGVCSG